MAHKHSVYDTDPYFVLNEQTRVLTDKSATPTKIIQFDHNCERITFELPRHIDGHDMLECNSVQVHYINIDAATKAEHKDVYEVTDLQKSADDEEIAICSWLVSGNATQYIGALYFVVSFRCIGDDGTVEYNLNTARYDKLTVSTGINNTDYVAEEYADILEQWKAEIDAALAQGGGGSSHEHENEDVLDKFSEHPERSDLLQYDETIVWTSQNGGVVNMFQTNNNGDLTLGVKSDYGVTMKHTIKAPPTKTSQLVNDSGFITATEKIEITETTIELNPNTDYSFGEVAELTIEFAEGDFTKRNEYMFTFISGATPTVLTLPSSVQWANELTIEANKRYEISIVDNIGLWCAVDLAVSE